jgi:hypothetical protein
MARRAEDIKSLPAALEQAVREWHRQFRKQDPVLFPCGNGVIRRHLCARDRVRGRMPRRCAIRKMR